MKSNISLRKVYIYLLSTAIFIAGCSSVKEMKNDSNSTTISPGTCKVKATVVTVYEPTSDASGVCAKVPCIAMVRIDSVLGYGAGFGSALTKGNNIKLSFAFTLAKTTEELFPTMAERLPGLREGDTFIGSISRASTTSEYKIYSYTKASE